MCPRRGRNAWAVTYQSELIKFGMCGSHHRSRSKITGRNWLLVGKRKYFRASNQLRKQVDRRRDRKMDERMPPTPSLLEWSDEAG